MNEMMKGLHALYSGCVYNKDMAKNRRRRGFSLIELLIVIAIILVIAAIAVPQMNKQLMSAHEMAAIRQITTIHQAQTQYYSQFGKYAASLVELGPPASGNAGPAAADLIPKVLADGKNSGYVFQVQPSPTGYAVSAIPEAFNSSGRRTFYSDQTLEIHNNWTAEPATAASPVIK
jgi:type IV pilus assembly protein PilA